VVGVEGDAAVEGGRITERRVGGEERRMGEGKEREREGDRSGGGAGNLVIGRLVVCGVAKDYGQSWREFSARSEVSG
jgi:hypothetical protein